MTANATEQKSIICWIRENCYDDPIEELVKEFWNVPDADVDEEGNIWINQCDGDGYYPGSWVTDEEDIARFIKWAAPGPFEVIYTVTEPHIRAGQICNNPITDDDEISDDVTAWVGTREELIEQLTPVAERETGRPDFSRTVARNILEHLGVYV